MSASVKTAAVHPHPPFALINFNGASPVFFTINVCDGAEPWAIVPKSKDVSGKNIRGPPDRLSGPLTAGVDCSDPVFTAVCWDCVSAEPVEEGSTALEVFQNKGAPIHTISNPISTLVDI